MSASNKILQAAAGNAAGESVYVDDVFSTVIYAGGSAHNFEIGVDMTEGGLLWFKQRSNTQNHALFDSESNSDFNKYLKTNTTDALDNLNDTSHITVDSEGFNVSNFGFGITNQSGRDYVSWAFRKQAGFFDVVTYTGNGTAGRTVSHNLGSVPGLMIIKNTAFAEEWTVYHRSEGATKALRLDSTQASSTSSSRFNNTEPTATEFTVGAFESVNRSGDTIVAYLFAHDDQQFGDGGDESIIKCGSYSGNGLTTGNEITLGFEPQWLMVKRIDSANDWMMMDIMRGISFSANNYLLANTSGAEQATGSVVVPTATGFNILTDTSSLNNSSGTYIYIAIRRPMKTPEAGTEVFSPITSTGTGSARTLSGTFPTDLTFMHQREATDDGRTFAWDRLRGKSSMLQLTNTSAEAGIIGVGFDVQNGLDLTDSGFSNYNTAPYITYLFKRATGFFDVVAYSGDGANSRNITHNLGVAPELMIVKSRSAAYDWHTFVSALGNDKEVRLNSTTAALNFPYWGNTTPTSTVFTVSDTGGPGIVNGSNKTYIAYLFATLAGVSKVGSYTGTGSDLNVDCGFTAGARFILIKRTDSTGDWYVWDSARGIVAGNDPYFRPNVSGAEVTSTDYIDPLASGFTVTSSASSTVNVSSGEYIFLAIA